MASKGYRPEGSRHHVVIIGSGIGGMYATRKFAGEEVDVTLIDKSNHHLFPPLLYQVATGILSSGEIAPQNRQVLRNQDNVDVVKGEVTDINIEDQTVTATLGEYSRTYEYDSLIVAAGAGQSYFGNDHFAEFAPGMKTLDDALEIRARIIGAFERAELTDDLEERERLLTFVVVGAGPTGVELAGQIAEMTNRTLKGEYTHIEPTAAKIILLDGAPQVLPPFGKRLGRKAQRQLEKLGVEVRLNAMVNDVTADKVVYKDMRTEEEHTIDSKTKIWSAGVQASPLGKIIAEQAGLEVTRPGKVPVNKDLTVGEHRNVFVIGDMMELDRLPGVAQVAIQGGEYAAEQIIAGIEEGVEPDQREDFDYFDKGSMAIVSRYSAVVKLGKVEFTGFFGWVMWLAVHAMFLHGFRNRFISMFSWGLNMISRDRSNMATTQRQYLARVRMDYDSDEK